MRAYWRNTELTWAGLVNQRQRVRSVFSLTATSAAEALIDLMAPRKTGKEV
jgi:hypothetical protein